LFTQTGYNKHDRFLSKVTGDIIDFKIMVFNRWGKQVYESTDLAEGWDGTNFNNGSDCSEGVYFYIITYRGLGKEEPPAMSKISGSVTLLR
jgi:gliding motility-associated-like protein